MFIYFIIYINSIYFQLPNIIPKSLSGKTTYKNINTLNHNWYIKNLSTVKLGIINGISQNKLLIKKNTPNDKYVEFI